MDLFGVQELPTSKSISAPGWAYIPDTNSMLSSAAPTSRKRARHAASANDLSARQEAKIARDLAALEKEGGGREVGIPVPVRMRDGAGRATHGKVTPAVRKILQSQKTFANHLSDAEALAALAPPSTQSQPASSSSTTTAAAATPTPHPATSRRSHKRRSGPAPPSAATQSTNTTTTKTEQPSPTPTSAPATLLSTTSPPFTPHPGDTDPLLRSRIPSLPSPSSVASLLAAPALGYLEARARFDKDREEGEWRRRRRFCEVCGFWGRVRCAACGTRCCALECLGVHAGGCFGG